LKTACFIEAMNHLSAFVEYRNYLLALAQRILGSALDAEDLLQETFLRWQQTSLANIRSPKAFLSTVLKRLCLNHLESAHVRREEYVDSIALETSAGEVPPQQTANEGIAPALLILLERLSPKEQLVLLLRDVFDCDYDEIARVLRNSTVAYVESKGQPVVELDDVRLDVGPLYNTKAQQGDYPAPVVLRAHLPHGGEVEVHGAVDAFAKPHAAGAVDVILRRLDLKPFAPVADRYHTKLHDGLLTLEGHVEYAPWHKQYALRDVALENLIANYVYEPAAPKPEKRAAKKGGQKAVETAQDPAAEIRIDHTRFSKCEVGVVHAGVDPPYRVFVTDVSADLRNFSTRLKDKAAEVTAQGRFMASGNFSIQGLVRPDPKDPNFDLSVRIVRSQVKMLNDLLMAHAKIDVAGGDFHPGVLRPR